MTGRRRDSGFRLALVRDGWIFSEISKESVRTGRGTYAIDQAAQAHCQAAARFESRSKFPHLPRCRSCSLQHAPPPGGATDLDLNHHPSMPTEIYVSTDIEADGPIPGPHSMLSFASAAYLADKTLLGTFSRNLATLPGACAHPDTEAWWKTQPAA